MSDEFVRFKNFKEQRKKLKDAPEIIQKHFKRAMFLSVAGIQGDAREFAPVFMSRLRMSIQTKVKAVGAINVTGEVGPSLKKEKYPKVMEYGRAAGAKMPPPDALRRWVEIKLRVPKSRSKGVAFVVARKIARRGIKGRKYMGKAWIANRVKVRKHFLQAQKDIAEELSV